MSVLVSSPTIATDFRKVTVYWQSPNGDFSRFRLVRSQVGFPETAEDGVIIFDEFASSGTVSRSSFVDGEDNPGDIPLVSGRQVYYRVFLFTTDKVWVNAGDITAIVPSDHQAHQQLMDSLPKVFTSSEQSPLGVVDYNSAIADFLWGFSFTLEEFYTYLELLRPRHTGLETPYELIPAEVSNVGLTPEPGLPTKNQKRLIREANYMYSRKGIKSAIETYAEALTGFAPVITVSENLLLTVQDSTFYNSTGNWIFSNATAEANTEQVPAPGDNVIDTLYACEITASDGFSMVLGEEDPIRKGIPVNSNTEYTASFKVKSPPSDGSVSITIGWYDGSGTFLNSDSSSMVSANNTWKTVSVTATSPADALYVGLQISSNADGHYYIDQVCMQLGDTVSYDEARAIDIFLEPTKTNYIKNPSFEVNVTDSWTIDGSATVAQNVDVSDLAYSGVKSAKIIATDPWSYTSNALPIEQGMYYTASGLIKSNANLQVTFVGRDSGGDIVETADLFNIATTTTWSSFSITHLTDAFDAGVATYELKFEGDAGTYYLDCIQFEKGTRASDYFDGDLPSNFGAVWEGTESNSYTHLYQNKPTKVPRLGKTLADWVPMNAFWRLRSYDGLEYTNLTV